MMSKKILVTGAGGYIGSVTTDLLLQKGFSVVAVDNFSRGYKSPLVYLQNKYGKDKLTWYQKDLIKDNLEDIFKKEKIELIIHFAALCNVGESWDNPELYFGNNVVGLQKLSDAAISAKVDKMIFSSTCAVYGDAKYIPIDEKHPLANPSSPYGSTKKICEEILEWYSKTNLMKYVFLRYFNVTGASDDGSLGDSKNPSFHLIQNAVRGALGIDKFELNYATVNTPDGSPIRDYINVVDLAQAHVLAADYLLKDNSESNIFNLGTGSGNSVLEIVSLVKEKTGVDFEVSSAKDRRKGEADKMVADITKAEKILGWKPRHSLEESINSLINWYKKYPKGWNN